MFHDISTAQSDTHKALVNPNAIRPCRIKRPLSHYAIGSIMDALTFDNQDCSYLEDQIAQSARRILRDWPHYKTITTSTINGTFGNRVYKLQLYTMLGTEQLDAYITSLYRAFSVDKINMMLGTQFDVPNDLVVVSDVDFWWDVEYDLLFSFDKQFMPNLNNLLQNSFRVLAK